MTFGTRRATARNTPNTREWVQTPLFVYGTLRRGQHNYARLLAGYTVSELPATITGMRLYSVGAFPVMTEGDPAHMVYGEWMIVHPLFYHRVLEQLDHLEGYNPAAEAAGLQPGLYRREKRRVQLEGGGEALAWLYIGNPAELARLPHAEIPSGDWVIHIATRRVSGASARPFRLSGSRHAGEN